MLRCSWNRATLLWLPGSCVFHRQTNRCLFVCVPISNLFSAYIIPGDFSCPELYYLRLCVCFVMKVVFVFFCYRNCVLCFVILPTSLLCCSCHVIVFVCCFVYDVSQHIPLLSLDNRLLIHFQRGCTIQSHWLCIRIHQHIVDKIIGYVHKYTLASTDSSYPKLHIIRGCT